MRYRRRPPPPLEGDCYLVPFGAQGDWDSHFNDIAIYVSGGWEFFNPLAGWRLHNQALGATMSYDGVTWVLGEAALSPNGAATVARVVEYDHAVASGATSTLADAIPQGTLVTGVSARVTAAVTGSATGWSLGVAGDAARYGAGLGKAVNATSAGLDTQPRRYDAETDLALTAEGGTFSGGTVRVAVHLSYLLPPRS